MYNLYDIFVDKNSILKSIGYEYNSLSYNEAVSKLIFNMLSYNMLESLSLNIVKNSEFLSLLSETDSQLTQLKWYSNKLYKLDLILLTINNEECRYLISQYGSDLAKSILKNRVTSLSGIYLVYYFKIFDLKILLLGDHHVTAQGCTNTTNNTTASLEEWILNMSLTTPECLDIFVEDDYQHRLSYYDKYTIHRVILSLNNNMTKLHNVRYHRSDIRTLKLDNGTNVSLLDDNIAINLKNIKSGTLNLSYYYNNMNLIIEYLLGLNNKADFSFFGLRDDVYKFAHTNDIPHTLLLDYMIKLHSILDKRRNKFMGNINIFNSIFMNSVMSITNANLPNLDASKMTWSQVLFFYARILGSITEYYTLLRLFTKYKNNRMLNNTKCNIDYNKTSILYFGLLHVTIMKKVISTLYNTEFKIHKRNISQCITFDTPFDLFE